MLLNNEKRNLPPPISLQIIKQEDKTFGRLLSKEKNIENINYQKGESSFRVMYYGGATGSIPFHWESRPGTPKHALFSNTSSMPPLTPPPSYQQSPKINSSLSQRKGDIVTSFRSSKEKLFHTILSKFAKSSRETNITPISSSTYSGSSSGSNSSSSYSFTSRKNYVPRSKSPIYFGLEDDDDDDEGDDHQQELTRSTPRRRRTMILCFGTRNNGGACRRSRAGRHLEVKSLRKGFLSIFATHGTA